MSGLTKLTRKVQTHLIHIHVLSVKLKLSKIGIETSPTPGQTNLSPYPHPWKYWYGYTHALAILSWFTGKWLRSKTLTLFQIVFLFYNMIYINIQSVHPPAFFCWVFFFAIFFFYKENISRFSDILFLWSAGSTPTSLIRCEIPCTFFMNKTQSRDCLCHSNSTENHTVAHKRSLCRRENIDGGKKISLISLKLHVR